MAADSDVERVKRKKSKRKERYIALSQTRMPEVKAFDFCPFGGAGLYFLPASSRRYTLINVIQQGVDFYQRIGNKITLKSVRFRMNVAFTSGEISTGGTIRVILFYDKQNSGSMPDSEDFLLEGGARYAAGPAGFLEYENVQGLGSINMGNKKRWIILKDKTMRLPTVVGAAGPSVDDQLGLNFKVKPIDEDGNLLETVYLRDPIPVDDEPAAKDFGSISSGGIWVFVQFWAPVSNTCIRYNWITRVKYYDQ